MFILFNTLTVQEGIDVQKAHKAFLKIDEYRKAISLSVANPTPAHLYAAKERPIRRSNGQFNNGRPKQ
jgi:hypothetical protein